MLFGVAPPFVRQPIYRWTESHFRVWFFCFLSLPATAADFPCSFFGVCAKSTQCNRQKRCKLWMKLIAIARYPLISKIFIVSMRCNTHNKIKSTSSFDEIEFKWIQLFSIWHNKQFKNLVQMFSALNRVTSDVPSMMYTTLSALYRYNNFTDAHWSKMLNWLFRFKCFGMNLKTATPTTTTKNK